MQTGINPMAQKVSDDSTFKSFYLSDNYSSHWTLALYICVLDTSSTLCVANSNRPFKTILVHNPATHFPFGGHDIVSVF